MKSEGILSTEAALKRALESQVGGPYPDPGPKPKMTLLGEINEKLDTLGMLLSDVLSESTAVRERLLGAWPTAAETANGALSSSPSCGGAQVLHRLDMLIARAVECRDNIHELDARV